MSKKLSIKTGSPLNLTVKYYENDNTTPKALPTNIDFDVIHPDTGALLANLSIGSGITVIDAVNGEYTVFYSGTSNWPIENIPVDILYDKGLSTQRPTETFYIRVEKGYTS